MPTILDKMMEKIKKLRKKKPNANQAPAALPAAPPAAPPAALPAALPAPPAALPAALPQPSNGSKLTDNETINDYLHYLAIIDNIHDFFHKRGENCPSDFKKKIVEEKDNLEAELKARGINPDLFLINRVTETVMAEFESDYTIKILNLFGLIEGCHFVEGNVVDDNLIYEAFIKTFGLEGQTFYTTHDSTFKKKNFWFDSKTEASLNCKHYILKTPQNNFDSATSSASSSVIKKKTVIVYPVNDVDKPNKWIFKSNILTQNMGGKMSFKYDDPVKKNTILGSLALWKLFNGRKATFSYEGKTTTITTKFKPIGAFGGAESGAGAALLCKSLSGEAEQLPNPKTVAKKIYNEIVGNTTLNPDEKYSLILDLKRSGDWEQVLAAKWFKENSNYPNAENTIVITGDYLCFLFAAINNVDCVFLGAKKSLFYSDKIRQVLKCGEPQPSLTLNKKRPRESGPPNSNKQLKVSPNQSGGVPRRRPRIRNRRNTEEEQIYFYTEEDYMDDFYTLLKNIRHNTMSWHYETIDGGVSDEEDDDKEDYYNNIITLIKNFNDTTLLENFKTSLNENFNIEESNIRPSVNEKKDIYININSILQVLRWFFGIYTNETPGTTASSSAEYKMAPPHLFVSSVPERSKYIYEKYGMLSVGSELPEYKFIFVKIFLMSVCILFEYLSLYYEDQSKNDFTDAPQQLGNLNIKPGFPHIIESFYYFIITNIIYKRNDSFNLRQIDADQTIIRFLAIIYSLLGEKLLGERLLEHQDYAKLSESFSLQGFSDGTARSILLKNYYPDDSAIHQDNGQQYYKYTAKIFLFPPPPSSSQSRGGARKNKMIKHIKKKTKRKHIKKKTKRKIKIKIKGRKQKEENKTKNKNKKRKKTRRKKKIRRKKHTRRKHLNKSK